MRIAAHFGGRAAPSSSYKRIQRFLRHFDLPLGDLAQLLIRLMKLAPPFVVVIDRTEWKARRSLAQHTDALAGERRSGGADSLAFSQA